MPSFSKGCTLAARYTSQTVGWTATNRMRADLALHCLRLDMPFHKQRTPGELIQRIDGDVTGLANFFSQFAVRLLGGGLLLVGILILLFLENPLLGLGMLVYTGLTLLVLNRIHSIGVSRWSASRQAGAELFGYLEERISGADEIRAAGAEAYAMRRLYTLDRSMVEKDRAGHVVSSLTYNLTNLVYVIGYAAGLAVGVVLYLRGEATLGTAYLITYYVGMLSEPLQNIREQAQDLQQSAASLARVQEFLDLRPQVADPPAADGRALPDGALAWL